MELERAKQMLYALADGINPVTGEVLSGDDSCNQVEVVRALHAVLRATETAGRKKRDSHVPEHAGEPWKPADDEALRHMYEAGATIREIATCFGRTDLAVRSRLLKIGIE